MRRDPKVIKYRRGKKFLVERTGEEDFRKCLKRSVDTYG